MRRQNDREPVAALKGLAYLVVPLLGPPDTRPAVPDADAVIRQYLRETRNERPIAIAV
jgi:hypothetical protein